MLQQSGRLLQGYCSTHLFYFIAHETKSTGNKTKPFISIAAFILFTARAIK